MGQIAKRIEDKRLLKLIRAFLNAGVMENGLVSEDRGVPDVSDLDARHQFEGFTPVCARVAGDGGLRVTPRALLHVASLSRSTAIQAGPIAPLGVELDPVLRV